MARNFLCWGGGRVSCLSEVSLLADLMSLLPSVACGVSLSIFRLLRVIFQRDSFYRQLS